MRRNFSFTQSPVPAERVAHSAPRRLASMAAARSELEQALGEAGGADAPRDSSARLRRLLDAELARGARELDERRTGYEAPIAVAVAAGEGELLAALPVAP